MPFCVQSDGLRAELRIGIPGDHRCILNDDRLFRILKHFLKAGDPDPNYDPVIDFVLVTRFDSELKGSREDVAVTTSAIESDWEVVYDEYSVSLQHSQESVVTTTKGTKDCLSRAWGQNLKSSNFFCHLLISWEKSQEQALVLELSI